MAENPVTVQYTRLTGNGRVNTLIPISDVLYFKSEDKYTNVVTKAGDVFLIYEALKSIKSRAPWLIYTCRSSLVDPKHLEQLHMVSGRQWYVTLRGTKDTLAVSRRYHKTIRELFKIRR